MVSVKDVNFRDRSDVEAFYDRLRHAVEVSCNSRIDHDLGAWASDRECRIHALDQAVAQLNRPMLTAMHTGRAIGAPADVASLNRR